MQRRIPKPVASVTAVPPLVELDPALLDRIAGGDGPHGGWGMPSAPPTVNPSTGDTCDEAYGPHGGWKTDGPHGGW